MPSQADIPLSEDIELPQLTIHHHGKPYTLSLPSKFDTCTISDLSILISSNPDLQIPTENQKLLISPAPGLLKPPFSTTETLGTMLPLASPRFKIILLGTKSEQITQFNESLETIKQKQSAREAALAEARRRQYQTPVSTRKSGVHTLSSSSSLNGYTFGRIEPLQYLPNPSKSLAYLERLAADPGIIATMRNHQFRVGLLTEMNPVEHTTLESRTLGLNRNHGEVIELRLRTDAYDGYRDYRTVRKTLCHELAHNVFGEHDQRFWTLCKQIEKEVEREADWRVKGGRTLGSASSRYGIDEFYNPEEWESVGKKQDEMGDHMVADHGAWTGGEFVLGGSGGISSTPSAASVGVGSDVDAGPRPGFGTGSMTRRELMAKAAEERMKMNKPEGGSHTDKRTGSEK